MHLSPSSSFLAYRVLPWHNHRVSHVFQLKSNFQSGKAIHIRCCLTVWPLADWKWVLTRNEIYCDKNQQHWVNEFFFHFLDYFQAISFERSFVFLIKEHSIWLNELGWICLSFAILLVLAFLTRFMTFILLNYKQFT